MTKYMSLLAAALIATAGAASASNTLGLNTTSDSASLLNLGTVVADGAGVVEVYDYRTGQEGRLLGSEAVSAGANSDVRISLAPNQSNRVITVLKVDGQVVAQQVVRILD